MRLYRAQFISMIIMIVLGVGIFVGFNMEWVSIEGNMASFFEESNYADYRIISESGFSKDELEKIENISGVKSASRYLSVNADVKEREGDSLAMTVTENENVSGFVLMDGEEYNSASEDGIWLSDIYASKNDVKIGDKLTLVYKNFEVSGTVKGLIKAGEYMICVRDETQLMPDYTTYGYAFISPALYKKTVGMDFYPQINVISDDSRKQFENSVDDALGKTTLILSKDESTAYAQAKGESDEGKTMGSVLPPLFLLIAVLTMVTTMQRLTAKEKTQIGTLKALGFKDSRILAHYTSYAFSIGIVGSVLGTALGYLIAWYIMNPNGMMGTYLDMPYWRLRIPLFCIATVVAMILILTLIGFLCVKKILHGTAADALRPYEPKRMKALLIERTNGFHKLSFGTRWNLRDIMRHKSRTAMTLIGIIGCTLLVVGSLGMRDTMSAFLDMYYDGAIAYSSRIYVAEGTTKEQCEALADKYDGEYENSKNTVYLTFDDGPSVLTENLLYYLRQENVKATFFVVPERTEYCYSLLREISNAGHTIGIHSASHDYEKIYASVDAFLEDFNEAYEIVLEATGKAPDIYRFPGGSVNDYNEKTRDDIIAEMDRRGFTYFDWNVDSNDWQGYGWTTLYTNVLKDAEEFSSPVILFHNTGDRDNTVLVIEDIIKALKNKGYKFGSLSQKIKPVQF